MKGATVLTTVNEGDALLLASAQALAGRFAERADRRADSDEFVAENYADLKSSDIVSAGVPRELGGAGLGPLKLSRILRYLGRACPSTALAFSMHTHQVAINAWRWRHEQAPAQELLRSVAQQRLILVSTGGGDWLESSGEARPTEGGYTIHARKAFASGLPGGDLLLTSAVVRDSGAPAEVIHFPVELTNPGVRIENTWHTLGMRGTGSHDVVLEGVFIPAAAVGVRRPQGRWHHLFHLISMIAFPLVYSAYLGAAEGLRDRVLALVRRRRTDPQILQLVGELENQLALAALALVDMLDASETAQPGPETTNRVMKCRTLVARAVLQAGDVAMETAGGAGFYRAHGVERYFRDLQAARFHPLQEAPQRTLAGKLALGLEI